jgi:hypothetical protein
MTTHILDQATRSVEFPADALADIERTASRFGLQSAAYLLLLHAVKSGAVAPSVMESVREIFTHDRDILKELAK